MQWGPLLKYRGKLEWPGFGGVLPARMGVDEGGGGTEIRQMVSSEIQTAIRGGTRGGLIEKCRLQNAMFVMPNFWPWVGEEDKDGGQGE